MHPVRIKLQEDEQQDGEPPEGRATVAKEWQWNTNHREKADRHSDIYSEMEKKYQRHRIAIHA